MSQNDLTRLERWAEPLLQKLDDSERKQLARKMATALRQSQRRRIQKQQNVDGSQYTPRRKQKERKQKPIRFFYEGTGRVAEMKSYVTRGKYITGFDIEADDIRTFHKNKIGKFYPPTDTIAPTMRQKQGTIRKKLFQRMSNNRHLKSRYNAQGISVGFFGEVGRIASVHQHGLRDKVSKNGPEVQYEERQLLGFTKKDEVMIRDMLIDHIKA